MRIAGLIFLAGLAACGSTAGRRLEAAECAIPVDGTAVARAPSAQPAARNCPFCGAALVALESGDRWCADHRCPSCGGSLQVYADGSECGSVLVDGQRRVYVSGVRASEPEPVSAATRGAAAAPGRRSATPESEPRRRGRGRRGRQRGFTRESTNRAAASLSTLRGHPVGRPSHSVTIPYHAVTLPSHSVTLPSHSVTRPGHSVTRPNHSITLPDHAVTRPGHSVTPPSHAVTRPNHPVNRPGHPVTRPSHPVKRPSHPTGWGPPEGGTDRAEPGATGRRYAPPPTRSSVPVRRARAARSG